MSSVVRLGDVDTEGNTVNSASPTVFANGVGVARLGDRVGQYTIDSASPTVFANGIPVARVGDTDTYPATLVSGSPNVIVNS